jgi:hypothetical protein
MITVRQDGIFTSEQEIITDYLPYLNETIEIEEGVTFYNFFLPIISETEVWSKVFASHLGHFHLKQWIEDFKKDVESSDEYTITRLRISWGTDVFDDTFDIFSTFDGIAIDANGKEIFIGVEFTSLGELKKYPLVLDRTVDIGDYVEDGKYKSYYKSKRMFRVYDVIAAILFEISFHGTPVDREQDKEEMKNMIDDIRRNPEKLIPAEDVFKELEEKT